MESLLSLAKESIKAVYDNKHVDVSQYGFDEKLGVFVTLKIDGKLRGCIGYPKAFYPLNEAVYKAARAAAFEDTRFDPLTKEEFEKLQIEISVLTKPEIIEVKDYHEYLENINLGNDGLIIEYGPNSGLLLPQVPVEWNWDVTEYLENLCYKAGLAKDEWKEPGVKIYKFQAKIIEDGIQRAP